MTIFICVYIPTVAVVLNLTVYCRLLLFGVFYCNGPFNFTIHNILTINKAKTAVIFSVKLVLRRAAISLLQHVLPSRL